MSDIRLNVTGDAGGGVAAMDSMSDATGRSAVKWQEMANAAKFAAGAVIDFVKDSVKQYAESERIQKQLIRATGEYAGAIDEQAQALSKLYAVDDDIINQSSTLLAQWGGVGAASKETTEAILNYAAATGQDAVAATQDLIRNVESGGAGLAKMGVHFEATGKKGEDLKRAVAALGKKFGGAAGADADSLQGQLAGLDLAFEDIKKGVGESVAKFVEQTGAAGALTEALRNLNEFMTGAGADKLHQDALRSIDWVNAQTELVNAQVALRDAVADPGTSVTILEAFSSDVDRAQAKVDALKSSSTSLVVPGVTGDTNKGGKEDAKGSARAAKEAAKEASDVRRDMAVADAQEQKDFQRSELDAQDEYAKESVKIEKERLKEIQETQTEVNKWLAGVSKEEAAADLKAQKDAAKLEDQSLKESMDRAAKKAGQAQAAGDAIGAAFVNALGDQLSKLAAGEEFDVALFVGDILASVIAVAGTVIGTAYGQPALGAAVGNLAAMGVRAGASAISKDNKPKKAKTYHDGGWVDAPRHHDGTWIGDDERRAILQTGERVLSRQEVHHAGGAAAVDKMAKGRSGGGPTIINNIQAIDSKNAAESFMSDLGQGMKRALRTGHGDVPRLLGMSPR